MSAELPADLQALLDDLASKIEAGLRRTRILNFLIGFAFALGLGIGLAIHA